MTIWEPMFVLTVLPTGQECLSVWDRPDRGRRLEEVFQNRHFSEHILCHAHCGGRGRSCDSIAEQSLPCLCGDNIIRDKLLFPLQIAGLCYPSSVCVFNNSEAVFDVTLIFQSYLSFTPFCFLSSSPPSLSHSLFLPPSLPSAPCRPALWPSM